MQSSNPGQTDSVSIAASLNGFGQPATKSQQRRYLVSTIEALLHREDASTALAQEAMAEAA